MPVDNQAFKQAMAQFAAGVTVVTTAGRGRPFGLTASSFTSVSLDPPLVLVCVQTQLQAHHAIRQNRVFAVNLLGAHQLDYGMRFAGMHKDVRDRFAGTAWQTGVTGSPLLPDCLAWFDCKLWNVYPGGDHSIFVGEVLELGMTSNDEHPLLYHNRLWRRTEPIESPKPKPARSKPMAPKPRARKPRPARPG
jgi:flavin reductase (DIM6/NTAB) family NADH-FMN oxidoreductase RutF